MAQTPEVRVETILNVSVTLVVHKDDGNGTTGRATYTTALSFTENDLLVPRSFANEIENMIAERRRTAGVK